MFYPSNYTGTEQEIMYDCESAKCVELDSNLEDIEHKFDINKGWFIGENKEPKIGLYPEDLFEGMA